jgi:hypothetical protein
MVYLPGDAPSSLVLVPAQAVGHKVACRRCGHEFTADWGEAG